MSARVAHASCSGAGVSHMGLCKRMVPSLQSIAFTPKRLVVSTSAEDLICCFARMLALGGWNSICVYNNVHCMSSPDGQPMRVFMLQWSYVWAGWA